MSREILMGRSNYRTQKKMCFRNGKKNRQMYLVSLLSQQFFLNRIFGTIAFYFEKIGINYPSYVI